MIKIKIIVILIILFNTLNVNALEIVSGITEMAYHALQSLKPQTLLL